MTSTQQALGRNINATTHRLNMPSPPLPTPRLQPLPDPLAHAPRVQLHHPPRPTARATPPPAPRPAANSPAGLYSASDRTPLGAGAPARYHQRLCTEMPHPAGQLVWRDFVGLGCRAVDQVGNAIAEAQQLVGFKRRQQARRHSCVVQRPPETVARSGEMVLDRRRVQPWIDAAKQNLQPRRYQVGDGSALRSEDLF